jgi:DNA-binding Lrp family transcriptional regulator
MKNSKISDRQLAKQIGVSQPTVTRRRAKLEREAIDVYTTIPKWAALGYELMAFTFVKSDQSFGLRENYKAVYDRATNWAMKHPNVLMGSASRGMNKNGIMISVHKSYADFDKLMAEHKRELGDLFTEVESSIVNLTGEGILKPFSLKYLADAK